LGFSAKTRRAIFLASRSIYYYVTDRKQLAGQRLLSCIKRAAEWGVDFIQIREKDLTDRELYLLTTKTVAIARKTGTGVIVNGRADVSLCAGAQGVHLPSACLRPSDIRPWAPDNFVIGVSVHSLSEAIRAESEGADYVLLGPIFPTPAKAVYGSPLGLEEIRLACREVSLPVLGLGGIGSDAVEAVCEAGAAGVAGIRLFQRDLARLERPLGRR